MLFNSLQFLLFFPVVIAVYFILPHRVRWILLLASSYYFYMCWKAEYVILIAGSTMVDYFAAIEISKTDNQARKKALLGLSLLSNFGLLFAFKYLNFFTQSINDVLESANVLSSLPYFNLLLPIGISFYTFQTISYTVDVYSGKLAPEKHLGIFALYVSFWPQLVAGPIERAKTLLPQFYTKVNFEYVRVVQGFQLILWGFFKKLVIADRLAEYVNVVYSNPNDHHGLQIIIGTVFFAIQIYCDFSAYSDIAIGCARIMGINLMNNFLRPYFSMNISDFWKRWHISLSTWFKDYTYIPLGGNQVAKNRWIFNLFITFTLSGLWHGANWTYLAWGALHGCYIVVYHLFMSPSSKEEMKEMSVMSRFLRATSTFALVCFAYIFFRANSIEDAFSMVLNMFDLTSIADTNLILIDRTEFALSVAFLAILFAVEWLHGTHKDFSEFISSYPKWVRWTTYHLLLFAILLLGVHTQQQFIYFAF